ncbi:cupin domain-containing protein [Paraburkholderia megapolitana]|uniref:cupin domain-containing protein n=1 Tax=Paraburkholderia megapolitana TaxID=420953 RepID=UPI0038BB6FE6
MPIVRIPRPTPTPDGEALAGWSRRHFTRSALGVAAASLLLTRGTSIAQTIPVQMKGITRTTLERHAIPGTDQELRMDLVTLLPGVSAPLHHHPVAGLNYIIEGTAESAYGNDPPRLYHAGESLQDQAMVPHTLFRNVDDHAVLRFLIFSTITVGQPYTVVP